MSVGTATECKLEIVVATEYKRPAGPGLVTHGAIKTVTSATVSTCSNASTNPSDCEFLKLPRGINGSNKTLTPQVCFQHRVIGFSVEGEGYVWGPYYINDLLGVGLLDIKPELSILYVQFEVADGNPTNSHTFSGPTNTIHNMYTHVVALWAGHASSNSPLQTSLLCFSL